MSPTQVDVLQAYRTRTARGVRQLWKEDIEQVTALLEQLGYPQAGTQVDERLRRWADSDDDAAFVWDERGTLLGVVAAHLVPMFERDEPRLRIVTLVVHEDARGRGVGTSLVAAVEAFAGQRRCGDVEVTSALHREGAQAFYRALGYRDQTGDASRFVRRLP